MLPRMIAFNDGGFTNSVKFQQGLDFPTCLHSKYSRLAEISWPASKNP